MSDLINDYWTKTPPIEGQPELTNADAYWNQMYEQQRKDRMQDCIDDYLNDDKCDARRAYEEMLSCIDDVINYHKKQLDKAVSLKSLMMGHRSFEIDIKDPES